MSVIDPRGTQPEALVSTVKTAHAKNGRPEKPGFVASKQAKPGPIEPETKGDTEAKALRKGVIDLDVGAADSPGHAMKSTPRVR